MMRYSSIARINHQLHLQQYPIQFSSKELSLETTHLLQVLAIPMIVLLPAAFNPNLFSNNNSKRLNSSSNNHWVSKRSPFNSSNHNIYHSNCSSSYLICNKIRHRIINKCTPPSNHPLLQPSNSCSRRRDFPRNLHNRLKFSYPTRHLQLITCWV